MDNKRITVKDKWAYHVEGFFRAVLIVSVFWAFAITISYAARAITGA